MSTLLILNGKIVNDNSIIESDIYIRNGRIEKIGKDLSSMKVLHVLDLKGKYLLPGMIDANVHCREPGKTEKGDFSYESKAAVAGGVTTFFDMPDTLPTTTDFQALGDKIKLAAEKSLANYSCYLGATNDNLEVIKALDPDLHCGVKICLGDRRGGVLVDKPEIIEQIFVHSPVLIAAHCEDMPSIIENEESYRQIYGDDIPFELHPKIRSEEACFKSSSMMVELARAHDSRLHLLHLSTAKELELLSGQALNEKRITAEVCYPYLEFSDEDYVNEKKPKQGALIKSNPAIKTVVDRAALFQGLMDDHLDTIASGHAPCDWMDKSGSYFDVVQGMPLLQYALPSLLEHYHDGIFSLEFIAQKTSHAVAELFGIKDRGYIREGYWADLVAVDIDKPFIARHEDVLSKSAWTPFYGNEFRSSVYATIVNGNLVYINDTVRLDSEKGMQIEFNRSEATDLTN